MKMPKVDSNIELRISLPLTAPMKIPSRRKHQTQIIGEIINHGR